MAKRPTPGPSLGRLATGLPRFYMDVGWWRHPTYAGLDEATLFVAHAAVGYCTEHGTDGTMPGDPDALAQAIGVRTASARKAVKLLVERGAWVHDGPFLQIAGYAQHNPTKAEVGEYAEQRSVLARKGNHQRWHVDRGVVDEACELCRDDPAAIPRESRTGIPPGNPQGIRTGIHQESHGMGWDGISPSPPIPGPTPSEATEEEDPPPGQPTAATDLDATWAHMARQLTDDAITAGEANPRNRAAYEATVATNLADQHTATAERITAGCARRLEPWELAERLDPRCGPDDGGLARAQAEAERTRATLAATEAAHPPGLTDAQRAANNQLRDTIRTNGHRPPPDEVIHN